MSENEEVFDYTASLGAMYLLKKQELIERMGQIGLDTSGTLDVLRARFSAYVKEARQRKSTQNLCEEIEKATSEREYKGENNITLQVPTRHIHSQTSAPPATLTTPLDENHQQVPGDIIHEKASLATNHQQTFDSMNEHPRRHDAEVMNTVRKWNLKFDAAGNAFEFLERIEELAECYDIHTNDLVRTLPEILRGTALEWFRINRSRMNTWKEFQTSFLNHFLPARYVCKLEDEIFRRKQGPREKAKEFIQATQYLIHRHPHMSLEGSVDRIYDSLRPEYHLYIKRRDFDTVEELMKLAEEYEYIQSEDRTSRQPTPRSSPVLNRAAPSFNNRSPPPPRVSFDQRNDNNRPAYRSNNHANPFAREPQSAHPAQYDRATHCWNCKQRGHTKSNCRRPFRLFCSYCGEDGRLTDDCACHPHRASVMKERRRVENTEAEITPVMVPESESENTNNQLTSDDCGPTNQATTIQDRHGRTVSAC